MRKLFDKIKTFFYPVVMKAGKMIQDQLVIENKNAVKPNTDFYSLNVVLNNQEPFSFEKLKGKKVMIVNTASACGLTPQYKELQELSEKFADSLVIIGFPANDFKEQEKGTDEEIAQFCQLNYGVSFPLVKKSTVIKNAQQNGVFKWLTDAQQNGWNEQEPTWNFSKYLVNEEGVLTHYFQPMLSPMSDEVLSAIKK